MNETLKLIERFHGHLGPFAVIGYRMGKIACKKLNNDPFSKSAEVFTGTNPPISCIVDGIQLGSGCTLGKGNIKIQDKKQPTAIFSDTNGKKITITLKKEIKDEIDRNVTDENIIEYSERIYEKTDEELFELK